MGFDPSAIRFAIELLGSDHVLAGSDWPIMPIASRQQVEESLSTLELTELQVAAILGGNAMRLLTEHIASK
jgi:aminocarboxymuconate-semialdehyde decarboxylase